jgi:Mg-chelatase subunit ChlD
MHHLFLLSHIKSINKKVFKAAISFILFMLVCQSAFAQIVNVSPAVYDFGTVQLWKNDTAYFRLENNGSKFVFLPIGYEQDLLVILPKGKIESGQSVTVKLIYFTQNRGNFRREIPVFISNSNEPIYLTIKGKIIDFHPNAMLNCPSLIEDKPPVVADKPLEIQVVDAISGEGLIGYNLLIKNDLDQQLVEKSGKSTCYFDGLKNGKYKIKVELTGYESKEQEIVITKFSRKFIVKLNQDEGPIAMNPEDVNKKSDPIVLEKPSDDEQEKKDIEKLRQKFREIYKDKIIIEKDVIVVKDGEKDSTVKTDTTQEVNTSNLPDFTPNGILNKDKYASNNIVFLIDISSSMDNPAKLPYLKKAVKDMVKVLRKEDLVTVIVYSSKVKTMLQGEPGSNKATINKVIDDLQAKGLSNGTEGMNIAYVNAKENFIVKGNNQIILVSDGLFNADNFSPKTMYKLAKQMATEENIKTSAIGFGKNKEAIDFMKELALNGAGNFIRIGNENDAATALVDEIMKNSAK